MLDVLKPPVWLGWLAVPVAIASSWLGFVIGLSIGWLPIVAAPAFFLFGLAFYSAWAYQRGTRDGFGAHTELVPSENIGLASVGWGLALFVPILAFYAIVHLPTIWYKHGLVVGARMTEAPASPHWTIIRFASIVAAVAVIAAAFMPWVKAEVFFFSSSINGMDRDGPYTAALGVAIIVAILASVYTRLASRHAFTAVAVFGAAIALIGFLTWIDVQGAVDVDGSELEALPFVSVSPQSGLVLTTIAGAIAATLGLAGIRLDAPPPKRNG